MKPIFDGKTLNGWDGDSRLWKVEDGMIVGSTEGVKLTRNTFLVYKDREFGDFTLSCEVKLRNHNSGIQFRSVASEGWVVKGYQADMAEDAWWGSIYDEGGRRGILVNGWLGKAQNVVKAGDWNKVEIRCKGESIQIRINGMLTAELIDSMRLRGVIALQLHQGPPMMVWFRNFEMTAMD